MKKLLVIVFFLSSIIVANSQNLTVEGTAPNLYITHVVAPKENYYSIGRLYNQAPKSIAAFNSLTLEKGLTIGQRVKVPLNTQNLDLTGKAGAGETLIPLAHVVAKSETLFKIGTDHNVNAQLLKEWNNLSSDNIAPGTPLIVGHLKVGNSQAANTASSISSTSPAPVVTTTTPVVVTETPVVTTEKSATKSESIPVTKETSTVRSEAINEAKPANGTKKEELFESVSPPEKKEVIEPTMQPKVSKKVSQEPTAGTAREELFETVKPAEQKPETVNTGNVSPAPTVKAENTARQANEVSSSLAGVQTTESTTAKAKNIESRKDDFSSFGSIEGAFAANFANTTAKRSMSTLSGEAGTFKSTSGWQDKRYYILINDIPPGTIVKISSAENKVVYAKVLGSMPEMKENNGLLLRLSNAAASYLGIIDPKFPVELSYYQ